jgi:hypothetical protein
MLLKRGEPKNLPRGIQQTTSISATEKQIFICWSALNLVVALLFGLWFGVMLGLGYQSDFTYTTAMSMNPDLTRADVWRNVVYQTLWSPFWLALPLLLLWSLNYFIYVDEWRVFRKAGFRVSLAGTCLLFVGVGLADWDALRSYPEPDSPHYQEK